MTKLKEKHIDTIRLQKVLVILRKIVKFNPKRFELCCDEFAYDRLVENYRTSIKKVIKVGTKRLT